MARFLSVDWDHQRLQMVSGTVKHGTVRLHQAVVLAEEKSPNPADAEALGRLLRERMKAAGIAPAPVFISVGRDRVVLKEIRHPPVTPAEEPAMVRFQAVKELTDHPDEVVIDYAPIGATPTGERRALALILRRELLTTYQTLCKAAGLKLVAVCPRPFGTAACLGGVAGTTVLTPAPEPPDAAVAVLTVTAGWVEFCVVRSGNLLFARTLASLPSATGDGAILGEIRRNLAVYAGQTGQQGVHALYIAGGAEAGALRQRLQDTLAIPVYALDPFAGAERPDLPAEDRGLFAGAVGLLYAQALRRDVPINFVRPKEPRVQRDPHQGRIMVAAAIGALILIGAAVFCYALVAGRDRELTALALKQTQLQGRLAQLDEELNRLKALDEWDSKGIVWLDELYDLTERLPDQSGLRVISVTGDPLSTTAKSKYVARMTIKASSNTEQPLNTLVGQFNTESQYHAHPLSRDTGSRFSRSFTLKVELLRRLPAEYRRRLPASLEEARNREVGPVAGPGGFGMGGLLP